MAQVFSNDKISHPKTNNQFGVKFCCVTQILGAHKWREEMKFFNLDTQLSRPLT